MRAPQLRALVLDAYARIREQGLLADRVLQHVLRENRGLHSRERRHVAESIYGMLRLERRLDHLLASALEPRSSYRSLATPERYRMRYAAVLCLELEMSPEAAASFAGFDRWMAGVLRQVVAGEAVWPEDPVERLAVRQSLPDWAARRLHEAYGDDADVLGAALNRRAPLTLRTNLLKGSRDALIEALKAEGITARPGTLSPWAVHVEGRPNVFGLSAFKRGLFEVQDEGSQLIALAAEARPGEKVVDACSGAGGKTLALAATMENRGRIFAFDISDYRLSGLPPRARRAGAFNLEQHVVVEGEEGDRVLAKWIDKTDAVLVDAPCTGSGSWRRNPDARWRMSEEEAASFPTKQLAILERSARLVRPGGRLVYATCSVFPEENEGVVQSFLGAHPEFEAMRLALPDEALDEGRLRVFPHIHGTDGFFAAGFRRS